MSSSVSSLQTPAGIVQTFEDTESACEAGAEWIARQIGEAVATRGRAVAGLATGRTPIALYEKLVARHKLGDLSFQDVVTYNLDEYYPISPLDPNSYHAYMDRHLFAHVDLPANRAHVLDGTVPEAFVAEHCAAFDRWIEADGGLDFQILGLGRNGHIGFNEPCDLEVEAMLRLPTRIVPLHPVTTADAAADFGGKADQVPRRALTMGIAPIVNARSILVLAFGRNKAEAVAAALKGPITSTLPGSLLQTVSSTVTWLLDTDSAWAL
jgi:glucosamine-6-phosphate deaminase